MILLFGLVNERKQIILNLIETLFLKVLQVIMMFYFDVNFCYLEFPFELNEETIVLIIRMFDSKDISASIRILLAKFIFKISYPSNENMVFL